LRLEQSLGYSLSPLALLLYLNVSTVLSLVFGDSIRIFGDPPTPLKSLLQLDFRPTSVPQVNDFFRSPQVNYFAVYSTLQAIFVICSLGFWFQLTSFTSEIQIDVSDSNFHMIQFACSFSEAVTIGTADNYKLDTSKCVVLWLPTGCDCAASNFSA
jgi:hypothetical protein